MKIVYEYCYENGIVYEKVLVVRSIQDSLIKVLKLHIKFREYFLTGYSVLFLCYMKEFNFMLNGTNFVFVICSYVNR